MGGREVGGLANMLAAHMDFDPATHRSRPALLATRQRIAQRPGLKAVDLFAALAGGRIKALWIMATNPVDSMPEADAIRARFAGLSVRGRVGHEREHGHHR